MAGLPLLHMLTASHSSNPLLVLLRLIAPNGALSCGGLPINRSLNAGRGLYQSRARQRTETTVCACCTDLAWWARNTICADSANVQLRPFAQRLVSSLQHTTRPGQACPTLTCCDWKLSNNNRILSDTVCIGCVLA